MSVGSNTHRVLVHSTGASRGFSLLEVSIVLLIMGLLLGSVLKPFGSQVQERQRKATVAQLREMREALIGFAAAKHRLPCPLHTVQLVADCTLSHGYVPAAQLGLAGHYDHRGVLTDAWGSAIRYSVSASDADSDGLADFTSAGEMRDVGLQTLAPDFEVCSSSADCGQLRANQVPVVLVSEGARLTIGTAEEFENNDGDRRFVAKDLDLVGDDQFDDIVVWLSENILYSRLIQAAVLP